MERARTPDQLLKLHTNPENCATKAGQLHLCIRERSFHSQLGQVTHAARLRATRTGRWNLSGASGVGVVHAPSQYSLACTVRAVVRAVVTGVARHARAGCMQIIQSKGTLQKHSFKKYNTDSKLVQVCQGARARVNMPGAGLRSTALAWPRPIPFYSCTLWQLLKLLGLRHRLDIPTNPNMT